MFICRFKEGFLFLGDSSSRMQCGMIHTFSFLRFLHISDFTALMRRKGRCCYVTRKSKFPFGILPAFPPTKFTPKLSTEPKEWECGDHDSSLYRCVIARFLPLLRFVVISHDMALWHPFYRCQSNYLRYSILRMFKNMTWHGTRYKWDKHN